MNQRDRLRKQSDQEVRVFQQERNATQLEINNLKKALIQNVQNQQSLEKELSEKRDH